MNRTQLSSIQEARDNYWTSDLDQAFLNYVDAFESTPKAWWLAMEAIRCRRAALPHAQRENIIICWPNYIGNSYQPNLYSESKPFNYKVLPINHLVINEKLVKATFSRRLVFHQHWLRDIYWKTLSMEAGMTAIERHVGIIRALKSYGATIFWTLHNLIDHDATPLQEELNNYALRQMADVSDHIFVHTNGAGELLSTHCGIDLSEKYVVLEHPLYDDLLSSPRLPLPEEIKHKEVESRRVLVSVGMIRPYKGVPDLIRAFQRVVQGNGDHGLHLIIAGQLYDPEVLETLNGIEEHTRRCISLVARRLTEDELASLMQLAHVSVTSYKKILTSGSYFLATTFAIPTVAPRKGMFTEMIREDETGFLYDGSVDELTKLLTHIAMLPNKELTRVGGNALKASKHLTISEVSKRFFSFLEAGE